MQLAPGVALRPQALAPARARVQRRTPQRLNVSANTLWQLVPGAMLPAAAAAAARGAGGRPPLPHCPCLADEKWCKEHAPACKALCPVDLTGSIGKKRVCSVASHDVSSEEVRPFPIFCCAVDQMLAAAAQAPHRNAVGLPCCSRQQPHRCAQQPLPCRTHSTTAIRRVRAPRRRR